MELTPWRPTRGLQTLGQEMDDLFRRTFGAPLETMEWAPSVDVSQNNGEVQVRAELPGLEAKDIDLNVSGDLLTIKGEKKKEEDRSEGDVISKESYYGSFQRTVRLPATVEQENAKAEFKNGILKVTLPKSEESRSKKIQIES
ncbi:MAG: Hsp20/alpha crystallin family protein [Desulfobacterales bacterium]|nr:Hsp20/alpha crystallin family protein [Desulfobacterales bacterium]